MGFLDHFDGEYHPPSDSLAAYLDSLPRGGVSDGQVSEGMEAEFGDFNMVVERHRVRLSAAEVPFTVIASAGSTVLSETVASADGAETLASSMVPVAVGAEAVILP
jgi:hypothetical protein